MRYTHTMEYFSAFEKQEILPFETSWMNLEDIMPSKARQTADIEQELTDLWNPIGRL